MTLEHWGKGDICSQIYFMGAHYGDTFGSNTYTRSISLCFSFLELDWNFLRDMPCVIRNHEFLISTEKNLTHFFGSDVNGRVFNQNVYKKVIYLWCLLYILERSLSFFVWLWISAFLYPYCGLYKKREIDGEMRSLLTLLIDFSLLDTTKRLKSRFHPIRLGSNN